MSFQKARSINRPITSRVKLCEETGRFLYFCHSRPTISIQIYVFYIEKVKIYVAFAPLLSVLTFNFSDFFSYPKQAPVFYVENVIALYSLHHPLSLAHPPDSLSDSLLLWLSGKLSEEEIALLVLSLRLRRSATQLVKLRAGDSLSTQAFHVLAMWRRGLPAAPHQPKASQLANCLAKSGRPDLARELLLRQAAATRQGLLK